MSTCVVGGGCNDCLGEVGLDPPLAFWGMPSAAYIDDVFALVEALGNADITASVMELAPDVDASTEVHIDVHLDGTELRPALAVQQSLELCVDAAAILVDAWGSDVANLKRDYVEQILRERLVELTIVNLESGSFLARFSIDPRTARGRKRLVAIAAVAVVALSFVAVIPPAAIAVVGVLPSLADALEPDAIPQTNVPLRTIDPADVPLAEAKVITVSLESRDEREDEISAQQERLDELTERVRTANDHLAHLRTSLKQAKLKLRSLEHPPVRPEGSHAREAVTPQEIEAQRGRVSELESELRDGEEKLQALNKSLEELQKASATS